MLNYLIGSDPEAFLKDKSSGKIISAIGLIPGTKHEKFIPKDLPEGFGLQTDNILVEFNIPPIKEKQELIDNINIMKHYIEDYLKANNLNLGIHCAASELIEADQLLTPESQEFGCDPDFNCYTQTTNEKPEILNLSLRSAGCHFHIGYENSNFATNLDIIKYLDTYLGVPSLLFDKDTNRRKLYGKAGCFRMQPWGTEFRTLSSHFIKNDELIAFCYDQIHKAMVNLDQKTKLPNPDLVQRIINNNDLDGANQLIKTFKIL